MKLDRMFFTNIARSLVILLVVASLQMTGSASAQTGGVDEKHLATTIPITELQQAGGNIVSQSGPNLIQDSSFETAFGSGLNWSQSSTNFGTPVCPTLGFCTDGPGITAGPRTGSAWVWFGGIETPLEYGSVSQTLIIPSGCNAILKFYLWIGAADTGSDTSDYFAVIVDSGAPIFQANATQASSYPGYTLVSIDLSAYANGAAHTIQFASQITNQYVNFNLDDISLTMGTCPCGSLSLGSASLKDQNDLVVTQGEAGKSSDVASLLIIGDTTGVFRPSNGVLFMKNANTSGFADIAINYGAPGDCPITGDWDGNGTATIGIYRNGSFYLRNSNTLGFADLVFAFGTPGDQPIAGDWNNDGIDTIGVFHTTTGQFLLRDSNTTGVADASFYLGNVGDVGIAGDWNGDGVDTTGVFRPSNGVLFMKNTNTSGFADIAINYGIPGDIPVTGDWNSDGVDTIGVYRNGQFLLRNSNTLGFADIAFYLGIPGDMPIAGDWDGLP